MLFLTCLVVSSCGTFKQAYYSEDASQWQSSKPDSGKEVIHSLYLVGDTGELDDLNAKTNAVLESLKSNLAKETVETSLVFLGDNIYPYGMPKENSESRAHAEAVINAQLDCATSHSGTSYFIPGNHDWNKHKPGGRKAIRRQEDYIQSYFDDNGPEVKFYPNSACADPKVIKINKDLVYVFLDTQWWLQDWSNEKKMNHGCEIKSRADLLKHIKEIFVDHKNDEIVVLMHHPIKTDGTHGGNFSIKQHIFPLTEFKDNLWIPLPIIGSIYPAYRKLTGSPQDNTHVRNQELMQGIDAIAKNLRINVIFATGHDHGLQYFEEGKIRYIVSGAGGKIDYVKNGGDAEYARSGRGYVKLNFHEDFEVWAEYYVIDIETQMSTLEFRKQLRTPRAGTVIETVTYPPIETKTKVIAANEKFAAGKFKKLFLGSQYRDMWATPVEAEVIDLETKLGGLTPIKKGGGMASNSLRMEKEDGKQYILRSIKKDYTKLVPEDFANLKLIDVMADQNSASHPYNALIIPSLSQAAGVYYTNPKLVYLQHQKGLGNYNSQFPEELYLLEERPSGNWEDAAQFGNAKEIIGYVDLLEILREKKNHFVDQEWVLKSRLFDLFIHDWDRHDDQWRWIKAEENGKQIYRPIPRDRDQAFYRFKGVIPWYISNFMMKQFKSIDEDCKDVKHLAFNAKHFDRYFLHDLEWDEWQKVISKMQADISDEDIDKAISLFPAEILHLNNDEELARILKARRNNLLKIGKRHYDYLAQEVEISGTDNDDHFQLTKHADGSLHILVTLDSKQHGTLTKYDRTLYPTETNEVRLYGLRGKDSFVIDGVNNNQINIRIIGGEDKDTVENNTDANGISAYDDLSGIALEGKIKDKRSAALDVNEYDRNGFKYNSNFPLISFGNSVDDGWWFGGSLSWVKQGWRKTPYKSSQKLSFSAAPGSRDAYQIGYDGHFPDAFGRLDFVPDFSLSYPHYENYFGLGNSSIYDVSTPIEFNWVRMQGIDIHPRLRANFGNSAELSFGPLYRFINIQNTENRVSEDSNLGFSESDLDSRNYVGGDVHYTIGFEDNGVFPTNGFFLNASLTHMIESSKDERVTELDLSTQFYLRLANIPKVVFATQVGFAKSYGDLQFYQYADLGNSQGLRGFRNERFRGEQAFYHNLDLRIKLLKWDNSIVPMDIGILGGYDYGRVKYVDDNNDEWHTSQTLGLWFEVLGAMVIQPYYSLNDEQNTFSLKLGFNF